MTGPNSNSISVFTDNRSPLDEAMTYKLGRLITDTASGFTGTPAEGSPPLTLVELADRLGVRRERLYRLLRALGYQQSIGRIISRNRARAGLPS